MTQFVEVQLKSGNKILMLHMQEFLAVAVSDILLLHKQSLIIREENRILFCAAITFDVFNFHLFQ